jgi:hypothetical protein
MGYTFTVSDLAQIKRQPRFCNANKSSYYRGADKSLARPTSLAIVFSVQGTGGSPTGQDPENRVVIKTLEAQVGQFLLGYKCLVSRFLPGRAKDLSAPL